MVFKLGSILLSAIFGLNPAVAETFIASRCFRHIWLLKPLRMPSGVEEILLLAGICPASKMNVMNQ